jgi:hypothetical protein
MQMQYRYHIKSTPDNKIPLIATEKDRMNFRNPSLPPPARELVLEAGDGEDTRELARKIGLGFGPKIRWEKIGNRPAEDVNGSEQEEDRIEHEF